MTRSTSQRAGGLAGAAGGSYQDRAGAWIAVRVLADTEVTALFDLPTSSTLETIRAQTGAPIDDLGADVLDRASGERGFVYIQAKRQLSISAVETSEFASVIDECVRQFLARTPGPLDRYVVATRLTGRLEVVRRVLDRNRLMPGMDPLSSAASTIVEVEILGIMREHAERVWIAAAGAEPTDSDLRSVFAALYILGLDPEEGRDGERDALDTLRRSVLEQEAQDGSCWAHLVSNAGRLARLPGGADRAGLQNFLAGKTIRLRVARSNRAAVDALRRLTDDTWRSLESHASLALEHGRDTLARPVARAIRQALEADSVIVSGEPGAGKTGATLNALSELRAQGADVVLVAADRMAAQDDPGLHAELGITRSLVETLADWPGLGIGVVAIDGLDALRASRTERVVRRAIAEIARTAGRWRVLVSIRSYDLRYSDLASVPSGRAGGPLPRLSVDRLSDDEIEELRASAPELHGLATDPSSELAALLRVPFNLELAAQLLYQDRIALETLSAVRSQLALLDLYWTRRVVDTDGQGGARERILDAACRSMIESRRLTVARSDLDTIDHAATEDILSRGVLVEWRFLPDHSPRRETAGFAHHLLFDYAAARLMRGDERRLIEVATEDPARAVLLRPSFVLQFQHLWETRPVEDFWRLAMEFVGAAGVPDLSKLTAGVVAAERARTLAEVAPLRDAILSDDHARRERGELLLRHIVNAIAASDDPIGHILGTSAGPWLEVAADIGSSPSPLTAQSTSQLLRIAFPDG